MMKKKDGRADRKLDYKAKERKLRKEEVRAWRKGCQKKAR